ncbi:MAG: tetratricopeptide repeat protein [Dehalococcoidia bacterium]
MATHNTPTPFMLNQKGLALMAQGKYQEAIEIFEQALKLDPDYTPAKANLEKAHKEMGES